MEVGGTGFMGRSTVQLLPGAGTEGANMGKAVKEVKKERKRGLAFCCGSGVGGWVVEYVSLLFCLANGKRSFF